MAWRQQKQQEPARTEIVESVCGCVAGNIQGRFVLFTCGPHCIFADTLQTASPDFKPYVYSLATLVPQNPQWR